MTDYSFTTGKTPHVSHFKFIAKGGNGEVHKMLNKEKNEHFARKLIRPFGNTTPEDINNERKAITGLCELGEHENIVQILDHGELGFSGFYFIDMELCNLDLEHYLRGERSIDTDNSLAVPPNNLVFVPKDCGIQLKLQNAFTILIHIINGLNFAHKFVHRDLKPANILYSLRKNVWKISDFGFTSQASSNKAMSSVNARGTPGYRAPELMSDNPKFTKSVDVWAVGCILHELVADKRAFKDDLDVKVYYQSTSKVSVTIPGLPDAFQSHMSCILQELLDRKPEHRPQIAKIGLIFQSYCTILDQSIAQSIDDVQSIPGYPQWKELVEKYWRDEKILLYHLVLHYKSIRNVNGAIQLLKKLLYRYPNATCFQRRLEEAYQQKGDWIAAVMGWKDIVNKHTDVESLQVELGKALKNANMDIALEVWKELANKHPESIMLKSRLKQSLEDLEKMETTIAGLKDVIDKYPDRAKSREELESALRTRGRKDHTIVVWKELVDKHPNRTCLQIRLQRACDATADKDKIIGVWKELAHKHPDVPELGERLQSAFKAKKNMQDARKKVKDEHPMIGVLDRIWKYAIAW